MPPTSDELVDFIALGEACDRDAAFVDELLELFVESGRNVMSDIDAAARQCQAPLVIRLAHQLKGAAASVHARVLVAAAAAVESADATELDQRIGIVRQAWAATAQRIENHLRSRILLA